MPTNQYEIDFTDFKDLKHPNRFDPILLNRMQDTIYNWAKHYLHDGVMEQDLNVNGNNINNITDVDVNGSLDVAGTADFHSEVDVNESDIENIDVINIEDENPTEEYFDKDLAFIYNKDSNLYYVINNKKFFLNVINYGFVCGGYTGAVTGICQAIDITKITGGGYATNALSVARSDLVGVSGKTYGFLGGGYSGGNLDVIDYIEFLLLTTNAIDKGDLTVGRRDLGGVNGDTYGFFGGGYVADYSNIIDYINITTTTDDAIDKGDLTQARTTLAGVSGSNYGFFGGGNTASSVNTIDYIDITTTTGDASDKGDLTQVRSYLAGISGPVYGFFCGGLLVTP